MKHLIKKILREGDFDWAEEIDPYKFIKRYYENRSADTKHKLELMADDYVNVFVKRQSLSRLLKKMRAPENMDDTLLGRALKKYLKDNTTRLRRFISRIMYSQTGYDHNEFMGDVLRGQLKRRGYVTEDLKYWGVDGDKMGPLEEDENDWDWADDINIDPLLGYPNSIVRFLVSEDRWEDTQKRLQELGYDWASGRKIRKYSMSYPYLVIYKNDKIIYRSDEHSVADGGKLLDNPFFND